MPAAADVDAALDSFSTRALALDLTAAYGRVPKRPGRLLLLSAASAGSGCKRLNLFLRWMVRRDALDLGVWTRVSPAKLIVPLDTHVIRVGRCLRLTRYTSPGWRMARDITASLRRLDPEDPVKYDFALCHLGMMNACGFSRPQADSQCPLRGVLPRQRGASRRRDGASARDHPLDGEPLGHAREPGVAHPLTQRGVLQHARRSRAASARVIARRHEQPVDAVLDDFRNAAGRVCRRSAARTPSRRAATCRGPRSPSSSRTDRTP